MKLRLLGGPEEEFPYIVIADAVTEAMWAAQKAQAEWFDHPDSANHKAAYGWALLDWGRLARKQDAVELAERYITETGGVVTKRGRQ